MKAWGMHVLGIVALTLLAGNGAESSEDWKSRYEKLRDEFKNYIEASRRNEDKKLAELRIELAKKLLVVADSLTRVGATYENNNVCEVIRNYTENFRKNVDIIYGQLLSAVGLTPIEPAAGDMFDDGMHTAIGVEYGTAYPENSVFRVVRRGYRMGDEIVRPAEVIVSKRPFEPPEMRKPGLLNRIISRIRPTKHRIAELSQRMNEFEHLHKEKLEALSRDINSLKTRQETGTKRMDELESKQEEELERLRADIASLRERIKELEMQGVKLEGLAQDINSLSCVLEELKGMIALKDELQKGNEIFKNNVDINMEGENEILEEEKGDG